MNIRYPIYEGVYRILTHLECLPDAEAVKLVCRTLYGDGYEADSE